MNRLALLVLAFALTACAGASVKPETDEHAAGRIQRLRAPLTMPKHTDPDGTDARKMFADAVLTGGNAG